MKDFIAVISTLTILCFVVYGAYWVAKNVSYSIFYEDMVEKTIIETVKNSCLVKK